MKPTAGPYEAEEVKGERGEPPYYAIVAPTPSSVKKRDYPGYVIADTLNCDFCIEHPAEAAANAKLLAASWEMLEALKLAAWDLAEHDSEYQHRTRPETLDAIGRALVAAGELKPNPWDM